MERAMPMSPKQSSKGNGNACDGSSRRRQAVKRCQAPLIWPRTGLMRYVRPLRVSPINLTASPSSQHKVIY
eukprot:10987822-Karenia_brevis.AAC.1